MAPELPSLAKRCVHFAAILVAALASVATSKQHEPMPPRMPEPPKPAACAGLVDVQCDVIGESQLRVVAAWKSSEPCAVTVRDVQETSLQAGGVQTEVHARVIPGPVRVTDGQPVPVTLTFERPYALQPGAVPLALVIDSVQVSERATSRPPKWEGPFSLNVACKRPMDIAR